MVIKHYSLTGIWRQENEKKLDKHYDIVERSGRPIQAPSPEISNKLHDHQMQEIVVSIMREHQPFIHKQVFSSGSLSIMRTQEVFHLQLLLQNSWSEKNDGREADFIQMRM